MTDGDNIAQVAVVILLLSLAVPALATAYDYAGTPMSYSEEVTVDYNQTTSVSQNATLEGYNESVHIVNSGVTLVEGTDYEWNATSGKIDWKSGSNTNDGDTATIYYKAHQRTEQTQAAWQIIMPFTGLFGLFGLVTAVRTLWSYTAEVWDLT